MYIAQYILVASMTNAESCAGDNYGDVKKATALGNLIFAIKERLYKEPDNVDGIKEALMLATMEEDFTLVYDLHGTQRFDALVKPTVGSEKYIHTIATLGSLLQLKFIDRVLTIGCLPDPFFCVVPASKCLWVYLNDKYDHPSGLTSYS
jgi:hypothetical protein